MKRFFVVMLAVFAVCIFGGFYGCDEQQSSDKVLNQKQEALMQEANAQVGMPAINHFQERKLLKMVLELRDQENLVCYAYLFAEQPGKLVYIGKCIGYGLPYATEFTSPTKDTFYGTSSPVHMAMPQADPNGLFMPPQAEGTWVMMLDPNGKPHPVYIEPRVIISPFPLTAQVQ